MPTGVEHNLKLDLSALDRLVNRSLMPTGVEHNSPCSSWTDS